jgi:acyl carrier protein
MDAILETISTKLAEQLGIDPEIISPDSNILEDLDADSLDAVELIMALEDEYGITIEAEQAEELFTVSDVAELVLSLIS